MSTTTKNGSIGFGRQGAYEMVQLAIQALVTNGLNLVQRAREGDMHAQTVIKSLEGPSYESHDDDT